MDRRSEFCRTHLTDTMSNGHCRIFRLLLLDVSVAFGSSLGWQSWRCTSSAPTQSADVTPWPKGLSHRLTSTQKTQRLSHLLLLPQIRLSFRAVCHVGTGNLYSNTKHKRCQPPL